MIESTDTDTVDTNTSAVGTNNIAVGTNIFSADAYNFVIGIDNDVVNTNIFTVDTDITAYYDNTMMDGNDNVGCDVSANGCDEIARSGLGISWRVCL